MVMKYGRPKRSMGATAKRQTVWADIIFTNGTLAASAVDLVEGLSQFEAAYGANLIGSTITRIHFTFTGRLLSSTPNTDATRLGIIVGADTLDVADLSPVASPNLDWMLNKDFDMEVNATAGYPTRHYSFDLKAQRRLAELGDTLFILVQNQDPGDTLAFRFHARILLKLP